MAAGNIPRHVILTGVPGVGKTTLVHKTCEALKNEGVPLQGFYTEELRERGRRVGFDVVTLDGQKGPLARLGGEGPSQRTEYRVGQYVVQLQAFEQVSLPALRVKTGSHAVFVIDEIGKMEMFSDSFVRTIREIFNKHQSTVLATIPVPKGKPVALVEEIRARPDAVVYQVGYSKRMEKISQITRENRDQVLNDIVKATISSHSHYSKR